MNTEHERTLAAIEQRALAEGVPPSDTDAYIADELRVPYDHYVAYLLVWGAIEAYSLAYPERSGRLRVVDLDADSPQAQLPPSLRRLFELAGTIHEAAVNGGEIRVVVREQARDLIGELLRLAETVLQLSDLQHAPGDERTGGAA
ncbi:MAG: hypothetical protein KY462_14230 [Actinobacteria bacterium]|nr:hypothetical protein [Actinomycetota bacterium]